MNDVSSKELARILQALCVLNGYDVPALNVAEYTNSETANEARRAQALNRTKYCANRQRRQ
ncbi:hypothetical protein SAMN05216516_101153 [Izhakiella capsodis]|uniref:Uncharacterized protein n=1 Tax=Izhakiella capsodis TaxID=1367852 RepID=A0A1I4UIL5_9GAMM|nr:hypothetical protein [Izhakiella capsodis]SFM88839.1 hypothetical protein SAMN05216516_101153 [Izhakiella capsodis]